MMPFIATPAFGGNASAKFSVSLANMLWNLGRNGISYALSMPANHSDIARARNMLVHEFMKTPATHLLFIDADEGFPVDLPIRLMQAPFGLCAASVPKKIIDWEKVRAAAVAGKPNLARAGSSFALNLTIEAQMGAPMDNHNGFIEVMHAGTGFMCIKREAVEKLLEAYPETVHDCNTEGPAFGQPMYALFETGVRGDPPHRYHVSEDYILCERWRALGEKVWLYLTSDVSHVGSHVFEGDIMNLVSGV